MDIQEFVENTLVQIIKGVEDARKKLGPVVGDNINPWIQKSNSVGPKGANYVAHSAQLVHMVDFDIAVTADSTSDAGGKVGLKIAGIGEIGGGGISVNRDTVVSRVKFQVPITFPEPQVPAKNFMFP